MVKSVKAIAIAAFSAVALQGCAGHWVNGEAEFSCPLTEHDGVRCLSAREVYEATEDSATITQAQADAILARRYARMGGEMPQYGADDEGLPSFDQIFYSSQQGARVALPAMREPKPIRTKPTIMRVWFGPWEDENERLHFPTVSFQELESRKWNYGEIAPKPAPLLRPLQRAQGAGASVTSRRAGSD
jgi:conjugal transfer pilus assembly protein TraV